MHRQNNEHPDEGIRKAAILVAGLKQATADAMLEALELLGRSALPLTAQDPDKATAAPMLTKADGRLDFTTSGHLVSCRARGVDPWPGAHALAIDRPIKLFQPRVTAPSRSGSPGEILGLDSHGLQVACGEGAVSFGELQLPCRKRLPAKAALAGRALQVGDLLT